MWPYLTAGLALGILGSFHCVGMCGPLALSLPLSQDNLWSKFLGSLLYNAGRVLTYSILGLAFGLLGKSFALFGFQQGLSITLGALILIFLFTRNQTRLTSYTPVWVNRFFTRLRTLLGRLYTQRSYSSLLLIGVLNGLLPCGLVYMAMAGAVASGSPVSSVSFMAGFGLGTLPAMWAIAFFGTFMAAGARTQLRKVYPFVMALMAGLLIIRGLGLGIPYLSPKLMTDHKSPIECVHPN